jgi:hypothetical protein
VKMTLLATPLLPTLMFTAAGAIDFPWASLSTE